MARLGRIAWIVVASAIISDLAGAQPAPPSPPATPPEPGAPEESPGKQEARTRFEKGLRLLEQQAYDAALVEFMRSRALFPTRSATENAAVCLRQLHRYDEALELYEHAVREFTDLPADVRARFDKAALELTALVGSVVVAQAEPGASIAIDARDRGAFPPSGPLRVAAGTRVVRVYKEGYVPFEKRIAVAGGESVRVDARLVALAQTGRLSVVEPKGRFAHVVIDNAVVGRAPWEGALSPGDHTVVLRGSWDEGTQPHRVRVGLGQTSRVSLPLEELPAVLRVETTPADAAIAVDGVPVGSGSWEGRMRTGEHSVLVTAPGFVAQKQQVRLGESRTPVVSVRLQPVVAAPADPERPSRWFVALSGAAGLSPSLGGDITSDCDGACEQSVAAGAVMSLAAGHELGSGFGLGLSFGYLTLGQTASGREAMLSPVGKPLNRGQVDDELHLSGITAGAFVFAHLGERFPLRLRFGAGALLGRLRAERRGEFVSSQGTAYSTGEYTDAPSARYLQLAPEVRLGVRLGDHLELSVGLEAALLLALDEPRWGNGSPLLAAEDGQTRFEDQSLAGGAILVLSPGAGIHYAF